VTGSQVSPILSIRVNTGCNVHITVLSMALCPILNLFVCQHVILCWPLSVHLSLDTLVLAFLS
jgi:hypothetical protein